MAVQERREETLLDASDLLKEVADTATQQFLLAYEAQTTESILGGENHTVYDFEKFAGGDQRVLELLRERSIDILENQIEAVIHNRSKELAEYDISNRKKEDALLEFVSADDIQNFERFEGLFDTNQIDEGEYLPSKRPAFQAYRVIEDNEVQFAALQKFTRRQVLSDEEGVKLAFHQDSEEYDPFTGTVVTFLNRIDCFYHDGVFYILNPTQFEDIFDYLHDYKEDADDVLTAVRDSDINISDFDSFVESVRHDRRALRKMREIKEIGIYNDLRRNEVEHIVEDFNLSIDIEEGDEDEDWAIAIPDMRKKWDIIRLLNDDHLYSDLSKDRYQVYGKDNRS